MMRVLWVSVASILLAFQTGCGPIADASGKTFSDFSSIDQEKDSTQLIDVGLIFADEASYLCVPLSRFGIASSHEVLSVQSSCACLRPSIVHYHESTNNISRALRIDFVQETRSANSNFVPASLAVEITMRLSGGECVLARIRFLHVTD